VTVFVDVGPVVGAVITVGAGAVAAVWKHSQRREWRQGLALENVRTDIKGEVSKWSDAVLALTRSVADVREDLAYLKGIRVGEGVEKRERERRGL